jgi:VanZ family protein
VRVKWLGYAPAALWTAFVLYLGSRTWDSVLEDWAWQPGDKTAHFTMYGTLGLLLGIGWRVAGRRPAASIVVLAGMAVGFYDELHQRVVPGRSSDVLDFLVDIAAVTFGFLMIALVSQFQVRRTGGLKRP